MEYILKDLEGVRKVNVIEREGSSFGGCQGAVFPARMNVGETTLDVRLKQFYTNTYDDRGRDFTQNPEEEVEKSFEAYKMLSSLGFKVIPYMGVLEDDKTKLLVMSELLTPGKKVIDEKDYRRQRDDSRKIIDNCKNVNELNMNMIRTRMMQEAYGISLGFGVAHMLVYDEDTNTAEAFIVDVGEVSKTNNKYRQKLEKRSLHVPLEDIAITYEKDTGRAMSSAIGIRNDFYLSVVGLCLSTDLYQGENNKPWLKVLFPKHDYEEFFLWLKYDFLMTKENIARFSGEKIFDITSKQPNYSLEKAYLKHLDRRIRWFIDARKAVETETTIPSLEDYLPKIDFFDTSIPKKVKTEVWTRPFMSKKDLLVELNLPWKVAVEQGRSSRLIPTEIKLEPSDFIQVFETGWGDNLKMTKKPVFNNFCPTKIKIEKDRDATYYIYEGKVILWQDKRFEKEY